MTCPAGHATQTFTLPHPARAEPITLVTCAYCVRQSVDGGPWLRTPGYCDGCDAPTWRSLTHPVHGHRVLLWPMPETRFAMLATPDGYGLRDYCPACCPDFGATTARPFEVGGVPIATGACLGWETPHARYAALFTDGHGVWLHAHLSDGYGVSDEERDGWLAQWRRDRSPQDYRLPTMDVSA